MSDAVRDLYRQREYFTGEYIESDDHVPRTEAVRAVYATDYYMVEVGGRGTVLGRAAAFDRWLAEVRAAAWDEAVSALRYPDGSKLDVIANVNPYRVTAGSQVNDNE